MNGSAINISMVFLQNPALIVSQIGFFYIFYKSGRQILRIFSSNEKSYLILEYFF
jgi:hypothetical protein